MPNEKEFSERLIIGKEGFIASKFVERGKFLLTSEKPCNSSSLFLDLRQPENFDYSIISQKMVIYFLAAVSSPDECLNNYDNAFRINVTGTAYFIQKALEKGAKVIFFSSDVVYGESWEIVNENSKLNPMGPYAEMKSLVENSFKKWPNFKVFRLSYVLSKNDKFLSYLNKCLEQKEVAEIFHPFFRNMIYIEDLLDAMMEIATKWEVFDNQVFNVCGARQVTRKEIAEIYNRLNDEKLDLRILEPDEKFWLARPKSINVESLFLEKLLGRKPLNVENAIGLIVKAGG